jgi:uncharacterized repeat protein (TIGR02543 family)
MPARDVTIRAIFVNQYTATFNLGYDGAPEGPTPQKFVNGTKIVEPDEPIREGYTFTGWYSSSSSSSPYDFDTVAYYNFTLTAHWIPASAQALANEINAQNDNLGIDIAMASGDSVVFPAGTSIVYGGVIPAGITLDLTNVRMQLSDYAHLDVYGTVVINNTQSLSNAGLVAMHFLPATISVKNGGKIVVGQNGLLSTGSTDSLVLDSKVQVEVLPGGIISGVDETSRFAVMGGATISGIDAIEISSMPFIYVWKDGKWYSNAKELDDALTKALTEQTINAGSLTREDSNVYIRGDVTFSGELNFQDNISLSIGDYWNGSAYVPSTLTIASGAALRLPRSTELKVGSSLINNGSIEWEPSSATVLKGNLRNNGNIELVSGYMLIQGTFINEKNGRVQGYVRVDANASLVNHGIIDLSTDNSLYINGAFIGEHGSITRLPDNLSYIPLGGSLIIKSGAELELRRSLYHSAIGSSTDRSIFSIEAGAKLIYSQKTYECILDYSSEATPQNSGGLVLPYTLDTSYFTLVP